MDANYRQSRQARTHTSAKSPQEANKGLRQESQPLPQPWSQARGARSGKDAGSTL